MIWFLIFCTTSNSDWHSTCTAPVQMPSQRACHFVGDNMVSLSDAYRARYRCVGAQP
jgi:hypothetical protein